MRPNVNWNIGVAPERKSTYTSKILKAGIPFASQVTEPDTKYIIKYAYSLDGEELTMPENCMLDFEGGTLDNGTLVFQKTGVSASCPCFGSSLSIEGDTLQDASPEWFIGTDADKIERAIDVFGSVKLAPRTYNIIRKIKVRKSFKLSGSAFQDCFYGSRFNPEGRITTVLNATGDIDSIISVEQFNDVGFYSIIVEGILFTAEDSIIHSINGVSISTPGGPSRPCEIKNCTFTNLNFGIYIYGSSASASTNVGCLHVHDSVITNNNWGIYIEGRNAAVITTIENNIIEQNISGGIYCYDSTDDYFSSAGSLFVSNNILESNPYVLKLKVLSSVSIVGNYFEGGELQNIEITGRGYTRLSVEKNYIPQSGREIVFDIQSCIILSWRDTVAYGREVYQETMFTNCVFLERPFGRINHVYSCFFCYEDISDYKTTPAVSTYLNKNYMYRGKCSLYYNPSNSASLYPQQGTITAGLYRLVYYLEGKASCPFIKIQDTDNNISYGGDSVNAWNFIPDAYKKGCVRYVTDIELPNIMNFGLNVYHRLDSAISEAGLFSLSSYYEIPSMDIHESTSCVVIGESTYYNLQKGYRYPDIPSTAIGDVYNNSPVEDSKMDSVEIAVQAGDLIKLRGVFQYLVLDSSNKVLSKVINSRSFWPFEYTITASVGGRLIISVYNENYVAASSSVPYANQHFVPYRMEVFTIFNS